MVAHGFPKRCVRTAVQRQWTIVCNRQVPGFIQMDEGRKTSWRSVRSVGWRFAEVHSPQRTPGRQRKVELR